MSSPDRYARAGGALWAAQGLSIVALNIGRPDALAIASAVGAAIAAAGAYLVARPGGVRHVWPIAVVLVVAFPFAAFGQLGAMLSVTPWMSIAGSFLVLRAYSRPDGPLPGQAAQAAPGGDRRSALAVLARQRADGEVSDDEYMARRARLLGLPYEP